jgi:hypothetical protein
MKYRDLGWLKTYHNGVFQIFGIKWYPYPLRYFDFNNISIHILSKRIYCKIIKTDDYKYLTIHCYIIGICYWFYRAL